MQVFPLRPSAYLCVLCVNEPFNAESRRDTQRAAEETNQICHFLCKASENYQVVRVDELLQHKSGSLRVAG